MNQRHRQSSGNQMLMIFGIISAKQNNVYYTCCRKNKNKIKLFFIIRIVFFLWKHTSFGSRRNTKEVFLCCRRRVEELLTYIVKSTEQTSNKFKV